MVLGLARLGVVLPTLPPLARCVETKIESMMIGWGSSDEGRLCYGGHQYGVRMGTPGGASIRDRST